MKTTRSPYAQIRLYLSEKEIDRLEELARKEGRSRDNYVSQKMREHLDSQPKKKGGKQP